MLTTPRQSDDYYCQSQWQSISLHDRSTLMHQFHSQHYSHPAVDCRVVIPAMTITDSTLASVRHFVSHKESCMTSQHPILPHPFVTYRHTNMNSLSPLWAWRHLWTTPLLYFVEYLWQHCCYHDISWTSCTISMKLTLNI